jgi:hypothetical protein
VQDVFVEIRRNRFFFRFRRFSLKKLNEVEGKEQYHFKISKGETLRSEIHQLIDSISNKEELPAQWKEPVVVRVCKKGDETDCSNYGGMPLFINFTEKLIYALLSGPFVDGIVGDHQCGFRR